MLKHARVGVTADDPTADVKISDWNADHVIDSSGATMALATTAPSTPAAGNLVLFARDVAGSGLPAYVGPSGMTCAIQPFLGRNRVAMWIPQGNGSNITSIGMPAPTVQGTTPTRTVAATNMATAARRSGQQSAATAGSFCGCRSNGNQFFLSNQAGVGGFRFVGRWVCSDASTVAGASTFVGLSSTSVGAVNPSSMTNIIGVGTDSGDTNLQIMYNDGAGTATKIDLGVNFPDHTLSADLYEVAIFCAWNSATIGVEVTRLNTGNVARATLTTNTPAVNTLLGPQFMRNNGSTALAVGIDMAGCYLETDN